MTTASAFIDEAGQRSVSGKSSDHFVMSAVVVRHSRLADLTTLMTGLRTALGRNPGDTLHWRNIRSHSQRVAACQQIATAPFLRISTVVVCKRHFGVGQSLSHEDLAYLYTFRFLLERLSWLARDAALELDYTLAHVVRFKMAKLREYESRLRAMASQTNIEWSALDPKGGSIDQPSRVEGLQLADFAASATFLAFESDSFGNTEPRYLTELAPRLYLHGAGANAS